ncbi:MAG: hypothetical protein AAGF95_32560 [Chloroflexota bacterium]
MTAKWVLYELLRALVVGFAFFFVMFMLNQELAWLTGIAAAVGWMLVFTMYKIFRKT